MRMIKLMKSCSVLLTLLVAVFAITSCNDDYVGEFKLTSNIEDVIPDYSYELKKTITNDGQYIVFTPTLSSNFEYWGLHLLGIKYYIDNTLYSEENDGQYELMLKKEDFEVGEHVVKALFFISGNDYGDVSLTKEDKFYISSHGTVSEIHGDFYMNYNYVTKGQETEIFPELIIERSSVECAIDEVKYYIDGNLLTTEKSSPFLLKHTIEGEVGSTHSINVIIHYHDKENKSLTYNWTMSGYKIYAEDDSFVSWDIKSRRNDYINGETISLIAKLLKGNQGQKNYIAEFYIDGELIGKTSSFPYTLEYKLSGLRKGTHTVTCNEIEDNGKIRVISSSDKTIIITK